MFIYIYICVLPCTYDSCRKRATQTVTPTLPEREFVINNLLVQIHPIIEIILVDRPCAMGV